MSTINDWEDNIKTISEDELIDIKRAIDKLEKWEMFKWEYKWTGIFTLRTLIENQMNVLKSATQQKAKERQQKFEALTVDQLEETLRELNDELSTTRGAWKTERLEAEACRLKDRITELKKVGVK